jgi:hypothetical protein
MCMHGMHMRITCEKYLLDTASAREVRSNELELEMEADRSLEPVCLIQDHAIGGLQWKSLILFFLSPHLPHVSPWYVFKEGTNETHTMYKHIPCSC